VNKGLRAEFEAAVVNAETSKANFFWMVLNWLLDWEQYMDIYDHSRDLYNWAKSK
jgi:hypothetical protein